MPGVLWDVSTHITSIPVNIKSESKELRPPYFSEGQRKWHYLELDPSNLNLSPLYTIQKLE